MARKTPTKKQKLRKQYQAQLRRIRRNYRDIEWSGGSFSKSVDEIIRPVKNPTEATIRRLKQISKDVLYRKAKTETGEPGWKIKQQKLKTAQSKAYLTKIGKKYAFEDEPSLPDNWTTYTKKQQKQIIEEAWERRLENYRETVERESEKYQEPEEPYQWISPEQEPEPVEAEEPDIPEIDYPEDSEPPYAGEDTKDIPDFSSDVGDSSQYRNSMIDLIRDEIRANDDFYLISDLGDKFEDMVDSKTDTELKQWVEDYGHDFLDLVKHIIKYRTKEIVAKKYYDQAVSLLHSGITPLDEFYKDDNYYDKDEAQLYKGTWYNVSTGEILDNGRRFKDHTLYRNIDNNAEYKDGQLMWGKVPLDKLPKGIRQRDLSIMGYSPSEIEEILDEEYGE